MSWKLWTLLLVMAPAVGLSLPDEELASHELLGAQVVRTSPDGRFSALGSSAGTLSLLDWRNPSLPPVETGVGCSSVTALLWTSDSLGIWAGCGDGQAVFASVDPSTIPATMNADPAFAVDENNGQIVGMIFSVGEADLWLASAGSPSAVHRVEVASLAVDLDDDLPHTTLHSMKAVDATPDGETMVIANGSGKVTRFFPATHTSSTDQISLEIGDDLGDVVAVDNGTAWLLDVTDGEVVSYGFSGGGARNLILSGLQGCTTMRRRVGGSGSIHMLLPRDDGDLVVVTDGAIVHEPALTGTAVAADFGSDIDRAVAVGSDRVAVVSSAPWLEIVSDTNSVSLGETATLTVQCDENIGINLILGGDGLGTGGTALQSNLSCQVGTPLEVTVAAEDLVEGSNILVALAEGFGGTGHAATVVARDLPPSSVAGYEVLFGNGRAFVRWWPASEGDVSAYRIFLSDGEFDASSPPSLTVDLPDGSSLSYPYDASEEETAVLGQRNEWVIEGLLNGNSYWVAMAAVDAGGLEGTWSEVLEVTPEDTVGVLDLTGETGGCGCIQTRRPQSQGGAPSSLLLWCLLTLVCSRRRGLGRRGGDLFPQGAQGV